ncbi:MAG: S24 family peptidase [Deltaproteobacteria bacterium]|nr:S24 family peptidase [Deltaproteobacteria bacterium]
MTIRMMTELLIHDVAQYGRKHGRGAWAELGRLSKLSPVTVGKIARREVEPTISSWNKLHGAAPGEIRPPKFKSDPDDGDSGDHLTTNRGIPLIAFVSAWESIAWDDCQLPPGQGLEYLPFPPGGQEHPNMYCVRVRGDSMLPILKEGDTLYVHPEREVHNNDLVVYRDQDGAFVKRVAFSGPMVILKSLNPAYPDLVKNKSDALVIQRVVWIRP